MLKTTIDNDVWLVHQPDHARVSGYLAAHFGGVNGFARPGFFAPFDEPQRLRQEVVAAIAEHDNGWWEWEAFPAIEPSDELPLSLPDVAQRNPADGFRRWRRGVPRFAADHPYAALLTSMHAYYLYAFAFDDSLDAALGHPLFGGADQVANLIVDRDETRTLIDEQSRVQADLKRALGADPSWAAAIQPHHLHPHHKLLQLTDSLSLLLSFGGRLERDLRNVPRESWDDRVTLRWRPVGDRRIVCAPFPFDADPLEVLLPARVLPAGDASTRNGDLPLTRLHATPLRTIRFEIASA